MIAKPLCVICGFGHDPKQPHNINADFYKASFFDMHGREPTWKDALEHCDDEMRAAWERKLRERGKWSEPGNAPEPVLGVEASFGEDDAGGF